MADILFVAIGIGLALYLSFLWGRVCGGNSFEDAFGRKIGDSINKHKEDGKVFFEFQGDIYTVNKIWGSEHTTGGK